MDPKKLEGETVIHKTYGRGVIRKADDKYLAVYFPNQKKNCSFQYPGAFYGYLYFENEMLQEKMASLIEVWKEESGVTRREELRERYKKTQLAIENRKKESGLKTQRISLKPTSLRLTEEKTSRDKENDGHSKPEKMFRKGDVVLYGTSRICEVSDISMLDITGIDKDRLYYVLHEKNGSGTIYVAVDGNNLRMRQLISKEEASEIVSGIIDIEPLQLMDERKPEKDYKATLQKYDCKELLRLIKCIYNRNKKRADMGRKATITDEKYLRSATDMLYHEIGAVLKIPKDRFLEYLIKEIEK